jgi:hypothetical protein
LFEVLSFVFDTCGESLVFVQDSGVLNSSVSSELVRQQRSADVFKSYLQSDLEIEVSEGSSGGFVKGVMVVVAGVGLFFAKAGDSLFKFGARHADDAATATRHLDDIPTPGALSRAAENSSGIVRQGEDAASGATDILIDAGTTAAEIAIESTSSDDSE